MIIKVKDMFTQEFYNEHCDIDVYDDVCEELGIAFCGALLTDKAKNAYADVLEDEVEIGDNAIVLINHLPEGVWQVHLKHLKKLFYDCAGYGPADEYDDYFMEVSDYFPDRIKEFTEALKKGKGQQYIEMNYWKISQYDLKEIILAQIKED